MNNVIILLTACVNPDNMIFTALQDPLDRLNQYISALKYYLENTDLKIVLVENTNIDFSSMFNNEIEQGRLEFYTFQGNNYEKNKGKGYGEAMILKYALKYSRFLKKCDYLIKITGRLKLMNINQVIRQVKSYNGNDPMILCDCNRKITMSKSRVFVSPPDFYEKSFLKYAVNINDSNNYEFENALGDAIIDYVRNGFGKLLLFKFPLFIDGMSGTDGVKIPRGRYWVSCTKFLLFKLNVWARINKSYVNFTEK